MFAALVVGRIVGAIGLETLVERCGHGGEIVCRRIERQDQRADLGAQEMIGARRAERRERPEVARIDELEHGRRVREMADLPLVGGDALSDFEHQFRRDGAPRLGEGAATAAPPKAGPLALAASQAAALLIIASVVA